jgi:SAM-dependent methyltransferase
MTTKPTKLDNWAKELIVDPLSKEPLSLAEDSTHLLSPYGRKYPIVDGIFDLRLLNNKASRDQKIWKEGQHEYERLHRDHASHDQLQEYLAEIEGVKEVYEDIPVEGTCLDVGGHQGRLRKFLAPGQRYISCDPFLGVFNDLDKQPNLIKAYTFLLEPVNFVCGDAEFLPFKSSYFQTVHMLSVIDHFLNPELALNEAYRVLKADGNLVVGLYVYGGKHGNPGIKTRSKEFARDTLSTLGVNKYKDPHVWHPTYKELLELISECGFEPDKTHWQKGYKDTVCYIRAKKQIGLTRHP